MTRAGVRLCRPHLLAGGGCLWLFGAGLLCWALAATASAATAWQWLHTDRALGAVLRRSPPQADPRLDRLAAGLGLGGLVARTADHHAWAVTYGLWRPRIALSAGLCDRLSDGELAAVLLHEAQHRRCRDPLRLLLARSARAVLGLLPAAGRMLRAYVEAAELAADAHAMDEGGRHALASALWQLRAGHAVPGAVQFGADPHLLGRRVAQIERYPAPLLGSGPGWYDIAALAGGVAAAAAWSLLCLRG